MFRRTFIALTSIAAFSTTSVPFAEGQSKDVVDTAVDAGSFTTLVAGVQAAGLVDTLKRERPFTVFAPTDDGFAALPEGNVDSPLLPENKDQLVAILTNHVIAEKVMSTDLSNNMMVPTVQGGDVKIIAEGGVIHVTDAVFCRSKKSALAARISRGQTRFLQHRDLDFV